MSDKQYSVRAARCDHRTATNEEVYQTLSHITDPLTRSWEKLEKAKKIVFLEDHWPYHADVLCRT